MNNKKKAFIPKGAQGFSLKLEEGERKEIYTIFHTTNNKTSFEIIRKWGAYHFQIKRYFQGYQDKWRPTPYPTRFTSGLWIELVLAFNECARFFKEMER